MKDIIKGLKVKAIIKQKCGTEYLYPNCEFSKFLCNISKNKTITTAMINEMKKIGIEFEVEEVFTNV